MGTKGSKNTPITARINTGLFNQKKGVKEPLLDVGPAGVYGDNQTRDIPSPSKVKGYSMNASPFKQKATKKKPDSPYSDETGIQSTSTSKSAGDLLITPGAEITRPKTAEDVGVPQDEVNKYNLEKYGTVNPTKDGKTNNVIPTGKREPDVKTYVPGKTTTKLGDLESKGRRGMTQSWEAGSQGRRMKRLSDDISDSQRKVDRYKGRLSKIGVQGEDGKWTKKEGVSDSKFNRNVRKYDESSRNVKGSQGQYDTYSRGVAQGARGSNSDTFGVKTRATLSDLGDLGKQDKFNKDGKIGEPEVKANVAPVPKVDRDGKPIVAKKDTKVIEDVPTTSSKKTPDFFKKKSPLKMKYFK
mgnify:FL=1